MRSPIPVFSVAEYLEVKWAVEIASTHTKPAFAGFKSLIFRQSAQADKEAISKSCFLVTSA
jgi:hypothetical protein